MSRASKGNILPSLSAAKTAEVALPEGLNEAGEHVWTVTLDSCPWLAPSDAPAVEQLARLADEEATYRTALAEHGAWQKVPVQNARGQVIGERLEPHPAIRALRDVEKSALALRHSLATPPADRARLGLVVAKLRRAGDSDGNEAARRFIQANTREKA